MMNARSRSCSARKSRLFQLASTSDHFGPRSVEGRPNVPSTTSTKFLSSRRIRRLLCAMAEILSRFRIRFQARPVVFIRGQTVECNQTPSHIIRAFIGKKISHQVAAASRNDAAPILGVLLELVSLKRIDLVADYAVIVIRILLGGLAGESPQPRVSAAPVAAMTPMAVRRFICAVESSGELHIRQSARLPTCNTSSTIKYECRTHRDAAVSRIAAAIGEPARARMLYCLMDGHARTSTELAVVADVSPSTASVHLQSAEDAAPGQSVCPGEAPLLQSGRAPMWPARSKALSVLAGSSLATFVPNTPKPPACRAHLLRSHGRHPGRVAPRPLQGTRLASGDSVAITLTTSPQPERKRSTISALTSTATRALRRRFAYACVDWSERRPHLGGAVGAAMLTSP